MKSFLEKSKRALVLLLTGAMIATSVPSTALAATVADADDEILFEDTQDVVEVESLGTSIDEVTVEGESDIVEPDDSKKDFTLKIKSKNADFSNDHYLGDDTAVYPVTDGDTIVGIAQATLASGLTIDSELGYSFVIVPASGYVFDAEPVEEIQYKDYTELASYNSGGQTNEKFDKDNGVTSYYTVTDADEAIYGKGAKTITITGSADNATSGLGFIKSKYTAKDSTRAAAEATVVLKAAKADKYVFNSITATSGVTLLDLTGESADPTKTSDYTIKLDQIIAASALNKLDKDKIKVKLTVTDKDNNTVISEPATDTTNASLTTSFSDFETATWAIYGSKVTSGASIKIDKDAINEAYINNYKMDIFVDTSEAGAVEDYTVSKSTDAKSAYVNFYNATTADESKIVGASSKATPLTAYTFSAKANGANAGGTRKISKLWYQVGTEDKVYYTASGTTTTTEAELSAPAASLLNQTIAAPSVKGNIVFGAETIEEVKWAVTGDGTANVKMAKTDGTLITSGTNVANTGEAFTFTLYATGQSQVSGVTYKVGNTDKGALTATDGVYTIPASDVTDTLTIAVTSIVVADSYTIKADANYSNYTYAPASISSGDVARITGLVGSVNLTNGSSQSTTATKDEPFVFTVASQTGYAVEKVTYTMGGTAKTDLAVLSAGTYKIPHVTGNVEISLKVSKSNNIYTAANTDVEVFLGTSTTAETNVATAYPASSSKDYSFKVVPKDNVTLGDVYIQEKDSTDGKTKLQANGGLYIIPASKIANTTTYADGIQVYVESKKAVDPATYAPVWFANVAPTGVAAVEAIDASSNPYMINTFSDDTTKDKTTLTSQKLKVAVGDTIGLVFDTVTTDGKSLVYYSVASDGTIGAAVETALNTTGVATTLKLGKTASNDKIAQVGSFTASSTSNNSTGITALKAGEDVITAETVITGTNGMSSTYTATLDLEVVDKYSSIYIKEADDKPGITAGSSHSDYANYTLHGVDGRTGDDSILTVNSSATQSFELKAIKWTFDPSIENKNEYTYYYSANTIPTAVTTLATNADGKQLVYADEAQAAPITIAAVTTFGTADSQYAKTYTASLNLTETDASDFGVVAVVTGADREETYNYVTSDGEILVSLSDESLKSASVKYYVYKKKNGALPTLTSSGATTKKAVAKAVEDGAIELVETGYTFGSDDKLLQCVDTIGYGTTKVTSSAPDYGVEYATLTGSNGEYTITATKKFSGATASLRLKPTVVVDGIGLTVPQVSFIVGDKLMKHKVDLFLNAIDRDDSSKDVVLSLNDAYLTKYGTYSSIMNKDITNVTGTKASDEVIKGIEFTDINEGRVLKLPEESDFVSVPAGRTLLGYYSGTGSAYTYYNAGQLIKISADKLEESNTSFHAIWVDKYVAEGLHNASIMTTTTTNGVTTYDGVNTLHGTTIKVGSNVIVAMKLDELTGIKDTIAATVTPSALETEITNKTFSDIEVTTSYIIDGYTISEDTSNTGTFTKLGLSGTTIHPTGTTTAVALVGSYTAGEYTYKTPVQTVAVDGQVDYSLEITSAADEVEAGQVSIPVTGVLKDGSTAVTTGYTTGRTANTYKCDWSVSPATVATIEEVTTDNTAIFTPLAQGTATVTLTVTDANGISETATKTIEVVPAKYTIGLEDMDGNSIEEVEALAYKATTGTQFRVKALKTSDGSFVASGVSYGIAGADGDVVDADSTTSTIAGGIVTVATGTTSSTYDLQDGFITVSVTTPDDAYSSGNTYIRKIKVIPYFSITLHGAGTNDTGRYITKSTVVQKNATTKNSENITIKITEKNNKKGSAAPYTYEDIAISEYGAVVLSAGTKDETVEFRGWDEGDDDGTGTTVDYTNAITKKYKASDFKAGAGNIDFSPVTGPATPSLGGQIPTVINLTNRANVTGSDIAKAVKAQITPAQTTNKLAIVTDDKGFFNIVDKDVASAYVLGTTTATLTKASPLILSINQGDGVTTARTDAFTVEAVQQKAGTTTIRIYSIANSATTVTSNDVLVASITLNVDGLNVNGTEITYYEGGELVKKAARTIGSDTYYFGENGLAITTDGITTIDGKTVLIKNKTLAPAGPQVYNDNTYYIGEGGEVLSGWITSAGAVTTSAENGSYYADPAQDDKLANGFYKVGDDYYVFKSFVKQTATAGVEAYKISDTVYKFIGTDGKVIVSSLFTLTSDGKQYLADEDGDLVTRAMADADGKITIGNVKYVIADDNTAKRDDILYNAKVNWVKVFETRWNKTTPIPTVTYTITYTSKNTGETTTTTDEFTAVVTPATVDAAATEVTFTATPDLTGYFADAEGTTPATATPLTTTYKFKDGGAEGISDIWYNPTVEWTTQWPTKWSKTASYPVMKYKVTYTSKETGTQVVSEELSATATSEPLTIAPETKDVLFTATADLSLYYTDETGTTVVDPTKIANSTTSRKYTFKDGGEEGVAGTYTYKSHTFTWGELAAKDAVAPAVSATVIYTLTLEDGTKSIETVATTPSVKEETSASKDRRVFTATITTMDEKNPTFSESKTYSIKGDSPAKGGMEGIVIEGLQDEYEFAGTPIQPAFYLVDYDIEDGVVLALGTDYTVKYTNNKAAGTGTITINGKGNYAGKNLTASFKIVDAMTGVDTTDFADNVKKVVVSKDGFTYDGTQKFPKTVTITTKAGETIVYEFDGTSYNKTQGDKEVLITVANNVKAGTATVGAQGKSDAKPKTGKFKIAPLDLAAAGDKLAVTINDGDNAVYEVKGVQPSVEAVYTSEDGDSVLLVQGQDYTLSYKNNKAAGTGTALLKGKKNCSGKKEASFAIDPIDLSQVDTDTVSVLALSGKKVSKVKAVVTDAAGNVIPAKQLTVSIFEAGGSTALAKSAVVPSAFDVKIEANGTNLKDSLEIADLKPVNDFKAKITVDKNWKLTYTGEPIILTDLVDDNNANPFENGKITVKVGSATLVYGEDFEVAGYANNIKTGSMSFTLYGIGNYAGSKSGKVKIVAKTVSKIVAE